MSADLPDPCDRHADLATIIAARPLSEREVERFEEALACEDCAARGAWLAEVTDPEGAFERLEARIAAARPRARWPVAPILGLALAAGLLFAVRTVPEDVDGGVTLVARGADFGLDVDLLPGSAESRTSSAPSAKGLVLNVVADQWGGTRVRPGLQLSVGAVVYFRPRARTACEARLELVEPGGEVVSIASGAIGPRSELLSVGFRIERPGEHTVRLTRVDDPRDTTSVRFEAVP